MNSGFIDLQLSVITYTLSASGKYALHSVYELNLNKKGVIKTNTKSLLIALKVVASLLIGMCVVILFSVNKYAASVVLTVTAIVILLPASKSKWLKWGRIAFLVLAFAFIIRNISTTELPKEHIETGFLFFDKVVHLFNGFLKNVFGIGPYQGSPIFFDPIR